MSKEINNTSLLRSLVILLLGIIVLGLVYNMFFQMGSGLGGNMGMHGGGAYGGFSISYLLGSILMIFIKLLSILLVVGLFVGLFIVLKNSLLPTGDLSWLLGRTQQSNCKSCGQNVNPNWDYCPGCGKPLNNKAPMEGQKINGL